jgi:accessory secretory protein Asp3
MDRVEPSLPIIDGEKSVRVRVNIDSDVEGGVLLRFLFFQRNGKLEGSEIIRGDEAVILCPIRTYYYHVQLIAGGSHKIHFHDFTIEELED